MHSGRQYEIKHGRGDLWSATRAAGATPSPALVARSDGWWRSPLAQPGPLGAATSRDRGPGFTAPASAR